MCRGRYVFKIIGHVAMLLEWNLRLRLDICLTFQVRIVVLWISMDIVIIRNCLFSESLSFLEWISKCSFISVLNVVIQTVILWFLSGILALRFHDEDHANLLNSMWLTAITFLCVGYGDIVPNTYCGRGITLTCGMVVCINQ